MKIALNTLKYYVDINVPYKELCEKMTLAGFEIEDIEDLSEKIKNVKVGKILKIEPHKDSDHLQICLLDVGEDEPVQIVTGAQNVFEGALVPAALHNSYLPNGVHITKGKLRGVESNGMLCSGEELCLTESDYPGASVHGILILKDDLKVGTDMKDVLGLNDIVIDFKITANRPDCNSIIGVAKEIAVVLGTQFKAPPVLYKTSGGNIGDYITVEVNNYELCPRYVGRIVRNLKIGESPDWLKQVLKTCGMRPINNIVDITNFVMLETGQPMHAFNYDKLSGKKIIVRNAENNEKITTLDEKEYELNRNMLVIADGDKPSCLAGIMGGVESEITDDTVNLFLEAAKFKRDNIRRTCRSLGIRTEASGRFEKGIDTNISMYAMDRALNLIDTLNAGEIVDGVIDNNNGLPEEKTLTVTAKSITDLLGVPIDTSVIVNILNSLELKTTEADGVLTVTVPTIRSDIEGRADLAEEVMRIYGYDHIKGSVMKSGVIRGKKLPERIKSDIIKKKLMALGMNEITTYSFIALKAIDTLNLKDNDARRDEIKILNPLGEEYSVMRTQLITSMLLVLSTNYNHKNSDVRFFEISKRFIKNGSEKPLEIPTMSIGLYGKNEDFFTAKGIIETIFEDIDGVLFETASENYLHPGRSAKVTVNGNALAVFGEVHPDILKKYEIGQKAYVGEIYLDKLFALEVKKTVYKPLPKYPAVERDFAMLTDKDISVGTLSETIKNAAGNLCEQVKLFDVYEGSQIPEGKKSVAFNVVLRSSDSTLTDEQIEQITAKIIKKLENLGVSLRK